MKLFLIQFSFFCILNTDLFKVGSTMQLRNVTHVIFDMDGLLLDTETIYDKIIGDIIEAYGKEFTKSVQIKIRGTVDEDTAKIVVKECQLPITPEEFLFIFKKKESQEIAHPSILPGVKELIRHLYKHNIPIAVATSSAEEAMKVKIKDHLEVFELFHHIVCGGTDPEVKRGKPAPDVFLVCASRFPDKPNPSSCLVFEDAVNGVKGAITAGMQAVMVPSPHVDQEIGAATLVLDSLTKFKPELFGLPPM